MRAPPESQMPIMGQPVLAARSITLQIFLTYHFRKRTAEHREILGVGEHLPPVDVAVPRDHRVAQEGPVRQAEVRGAMGGETVDLGGTSRGPSATSAAPSAVILPRWCCCSMRLWPPPSAACWLSSSRCSSFASWLPCDSIPVLRWSWSKRPPAAVGWSVYNSSGNPAPCGTGDSRNELSSIPDNPRNANAPSLTVAGGEPLVWGRRTYVMGIINLTPDSFSGDGLAGDVTRGGGAGPTCMEADGADMLDVGAESTRPGSTADFSVEVEVGPPAPRALGHLPNRCGFRSAWTPIRRQWRGSAIAAGASMVNDVWGLPGRRQQWRRSSPPPASQLF